MEVLNLIFGYFGGGFSLTYAVSIQLKLVRIPPLRRYLEMFGATTLTQKSFIPPNTTKNHPQQNLQMAFFPSFSATNTQPHQLPNLCHREDYATSEFSMPLRSFARFDLFVLALDFTTSGASTSLRHTAQLGVMMSLLGALCCLGNQWWGDEKSKFYGKLMGVDDVDGGVDEEIVHLCLCLSIFSQKGRH